jgi:hypothetical protein
MAARQAFRRWITTQKIADIARLHKVPTPTALATAPVTHTAPAPNASKKQYKFALWCRVGLDSGRMLA